MSEKVPKLSIALVPEDRMGSFDWVSYGKIVAACLELYNTIPGPVTIEVMDVTFRSCLTILREYFSGYVTVKIAMKSPRISLYGGPVDLAGFNTGFVTVGNEPVADRQRGEKPADAVTLEQALPFLKEKLVQHFRSELVFQRDLLQKNLREITHLEGIL